MNFLFNTRTDWNEPPRARHQLARAFARNHHVIFVEINKTGKPSISIETPELNITMVSPRWWIHGKVNMRLPIINELYQNWLYKKLKERYRDYQVINFDITASGLDKWLGNYIYFCGDDFLDRKRSKSYLVSLYWANKQKKVAKKALFCTGASKYLQDKLTTYNNRSHLLLTGAPLVRQTDISFNSRKHNTINIVYVGWLAKLNTDWVYALATNKNYEIYLVGPNIKSQERKFLGIENIYLVGEKTDGELYKHLTNANVCIAPYTNDSDTEEVYTMPNKFWLYLSFGKPIVTCKINNLADLPEKFVYQSKCSDEFISNIDKAVSDDSHDLFRERMHFIRQNTWDIRVEELLALNRKYTVT